MQNFVELKYPEIFEIYNEAYSFYESQIHSIRILEADNIDQSIFKQIVLQFSVIAKQDLESIFILFQNKQFYTPQLILRSLIEFVITLGYVEKDPEKYSRQYVFQGIRANIKLFNTLRNSKEILFDVSYDNKLNELETEKTNYVTDINEWPVSLECRAKETKLESFYFAYRYLSMLAHPNPNNAKYFFKDEPDKILFYDFSEDTTFRTLLVALLLTNVLMSKVNEAFCLKESEKYEEIENKIKNFFGKSHN
ncbi:MAG: DUF5677 domain-containing protein [Candidatus Hodarchaeota archaeon]